MLFSFSLRTRRHYSSIKELFTKERATIKELSLIISLNTTQEMDNSQFLCRYIYCKKVLTVLNSNIYHTEFKRRCNHNLSAQITILLIMIVKYFTSLIYNFFYLNYKTYYRQVDQDNTYSLTYNNAHIVLSLSKHM